VSVIKSGQTKEKRREKNKIKKNSHLFFEILIAHVVAFSSFLSHTRARSLSRSRLLFALFLSFFLGAKMPFVVVSRLVLLAAAFVAFASSSSSSSSSSSTSSSSSSSSSPGGSQQHTEVVLATAAAWSTAVARACRTHTAAPAGFEALCALAGGYLTSRLVGTVRSEVTPHPLLPAQMREKMRDKMGDKQRAAGEAAPTAPRSPRSAAAKPTHASAWPCRPAPSR
jgi:hypothetical protein